MRGHTATPPLLSILLLAQLMIAARAQSDLHGETAGTIVPDTEISAYRVRDLDGDDRAEIVLVSKSGAVTIWHHDESLGLSARSTEPLQLAAPDHCVLALADVLGGSELELVVLSGRGVEAWSLDADRIYTGPPAALTSAGRLGIRVGRPAFAPFVRDVNNDGAPDLIIPIDGASELWLNQSGAKPPPRFELAQTIPIELHRSWQTSSDLLSNELVNDISMPQLDIADVNGDGRPDLRARNGQRRQFFLQQQDGRFSDKAIEVDLSIFRDTTPKASIELGETLVAADRQQMQSGDLDGDGIPDYVIAHRRKVWSFLASRDGPQFTKSTTRLVAQDVTAMLLVHLDDDERKDLLVFKVELPTAAELVLGLVSSIDIEIVALGYPTAPDGTFESRAKWRRVLTLRIPSLLRLIGEAEDLAEQLQEILSKYRWSTVADFDGDGQRDLALLTQDESSVELWLRPARAKQPERAAERWFRELLFENPDTIFDVERILKLAAQVFDARTSAMTGDRAADARAPLPPRPGRYITNLLADDLDGDGRAELILIDDSESTPGHPRFEVIRWQEN